MTHSEMKPRDLCHSSHGYIFLCYYLLFLSLFFNGAKDTLSRMTMDSVYANDVIKSKYN